MTNIIALVSQKGGVGRSTLARALAREAAASGLRVKLGDLDTQQGTSANWHRRRLDAGTKPEFSVESFKTAAQALKGANAFECLVLDGPARASAATLEIARAAALVVQPTGASADDLHPAVLVFHELVRERVPKSRMVFALCRIGTDAEEAEAGLPDGSRVLRATWIYSGAARLSTGAKPGADDHRNPVSSTEPPG